MGGLDDLQVCSLAAYQGHTATRVFVFPDQWLPLEVRLVPCAVLDQEPVLQLQSLYSPVFARRAGYVLNAALPVTPGPDLEYLAPPLYGCNLYTLTKS